MDVFGFSGVREAEPRLHVVHVAFEWRPVVGVHELDDAASVVAGYLYGRLRLEVPIALAIQRLPPRHVEVVAQTEVQGELRHDPPVVVHIETPVGRPGEDLRVDVEITARGPANQHRGQAVALVPSAREAIPAGDPSAKGELARGISGLGVVEEVPPRLGPGLDVVPAERRGVGAREVMDALLAIHLEPSLRADRAVRVGCEPREHVEGRLILHVLRETELGEIEALHRVPGKGRVGQTVAHAPERFRTLNPGELGDDRVDASFNRAVVERERGGQLTEKVWRRRRIRTITVAAVQAAPVREVVVHLEAHLPVDALRDSLREPVVGLRDRRARCIREREVGQGAEGDRIQHARRNDVPRERPALEVALRIDERVERVVDRHHLPAGVPGLREVPLSLQQGRNGPGRRERAFRLRELVHREEERLVLDERATQHSAGLIAPGIRKGPSCPVREPVVGIHRRVAQEVIPGAIEPVGARLGNHVHDGSPGLAELGGEEVRLDLELLHGIHCRRVFQVGDTGVLLDRHHGHAVEQDVGGRVAGAIGDEVRIRVTRPAARSDDARRQVGERHRIPREVGQRDDGLVVDDLAEVRDGGIHVRSRGAHLDGLVQLAHIQSGIDRGLLLNGEGEPAARELLESRGLDRQDILARLQSRDHKSAGLVGHRGLARSPVSVRHGDGCVRN